MTEVQRLERDLKDCLAEMEVIVLKHEPRLIRVLHAIRERWTEAMAEELLRGPQEVRG